MVYPADLGWEQDNELLLKHIKEIHAESRETYAWPRAHAGLTRGLGLLVNRKRVARLTRQTGIQGAVPVGDVVVDPFFATAVECVEKLSRTRWVSTTSNCSPAACSDANGEADGACYSARARNPLPSSPAPPCGGCPDHPRGSNLVGARLGGRTVPDFARGGRAY